MLTPFALFLGAAVLAAVFKSRPPEAAVLTHTYSANPTESWHPSVPSQERFECVVMVPGFVKPTPDTIHHHYLEINGLREIRVSHAGQTIERRTFPAKRL